MKGVLEKQATRNALDDLCELVYVTISMYTHVSGNLRYPATVEAYLHCKY